MSLYAGASESCQSMQIKQARGQKETHIQQLLVESVCDVNAKQNIILCFYVCNLTWTQKLNYI